MLSLLDSLYQYSSVSSTPANFVWYVDLRPVSDFHTTDNFSFTLSDGQASVTGTFAIAVSAVNDLPVLGASSLAITEGEFSFEAVAPEGVALKNGRLLPALKAEVVVRVGGREFEATTADVVVQP